MLRIKVILLVLPHDDENFVNESEKCLQVTWDRIDCFLPNLKSDLMATQSPVSLRATSPPEPDVPGAMTIHTEEEIAVKGRFT